MTKAIMLSDYNTKATIVNVNLESVWETDFGGKFILLENSEMEEIKNFNKIKGDKVLDWHETYTSYSTTQGEEIIILPQPEINALLGIEEAKIVDLKNSANIVIDTTNTKLVNKFVKSARKQGIEKTGIHEVDEVLRWEYEE